MTPEQYTALTAELLSGHPVTGAYNVDDALAAGEINAINRARVKPTVTGSEIANATDDTEFAALSVGDQDRWINLCGIDNLDTNSGPALTLESALFGGGTVTRANLVVLRTENISRATELGLPAVTTGQIEKARGG